MALPKADPNYFQEQRGVLAVATQLNEIGLIWRPTRNGDVGIDGLIEHIDDNGECTGHLVAAQIKSGSSFINIVNNNLIFYPTSKHVAYWNQFALPVILFVHNPATYVTYWCDARQWLRAGRGSPICLPTNQVLGKATKRELFETVAPSGGILLPVKEQLKQLGRSGNDASTFNVSFLDLFVIGMIDMCRKIFFSMDLVMEIVDCRAQEIGVGFGVAGSEYIIIDKYIIWLCEQNLARIDYADYLYDRDVLQLVPIIVAPLTDRGIELRNALRSFDAGDGYFRESLITVVDVNRPSLSERLNHLAKLRSMLRDT